MEQIIKTNTVHLDTDEKITINLLQNNCTDGSQTYDVHLVIYASNLTTTRLHNYDSTTKRLAVAKFNRLVKALDGFQIG